MAVADILYSRDRINTAYTLLMEHIPQLAKMVSNPNVSQEDINSFVADVRPFLFHPSPYIHVFSLTMGPKTHDLMTFKGSELSLLNGLMQNTCPCVLCGQEIVMVKDSRMILLEGCYAALHMTGLTHSACFFFFYVIHGILLLALGSDRISLT